jgi:hydroxymethylglutaryl-CoA lyase
MTTVTIREVGPGHGLRSEAPIPVATRVALIDALVGAGVRHVEAGAFVSPVSPVSPASPVGPAMAGAAQGAEAAAVAGAAQVAEVMAALKRPAGVWYWAMVSTVNDAEAALDADVDAITVTVSASEAYSRRNAHMSVAESVAEAGRIGALVHGQIPLDAVISCAFGSPYEGDVTPASVVGLGERLLDGGASSVTLADTAGMATPRRVTELLDETGNGVGLHFYDTRGTGLVNAYAALQAGATRFDTSVGGLGGSQFAQFAQFASGAGGSVATEDFVHLLDDLGVETGVDLEHLLQASQLFADAIGHPVPGRVAAAGPRWRRIDAD